VGDEEESLRSMATSFGEGSASWARGDAGKNSAAKLLAEGSEFGFISIGARSSSDLPSEDEGGRRVLTSENGSLDNDSATNGVAETGKRAGLACSGSSSASDDGCVGIRTGRRRWADES